MCVYNIFFIKPFYPISWKEFMKMNMFFIYLICLVLLIKLLYRFPNLFCVHFCYFIQIFDIQFCTISVWLRVERISKKKWSKIVKIFFLIEKWFLVNQCSSSLNIRNRRRNMYWIEYRKTWSISTWMANYKNIEDDRKTQELSRTLWPTYYYSTSTFVNLLSCASWHAVDSRFVVFIIGTIVNIYKTASTT